jgi:hypothetical protein
MLSAILRDEAQRIALEALEILDPFRRKQVLAIVECILHCNSSRGFSLPKFCPVMGGEGLVHRS